MVEPKKPFACGIMDCGMSFTNEDHLHVHRKKHDMVLQLGIEQKSAFAADQTPTPTRFIRNCEEVGLFQELQNVNPFDEGFKKAMETRTGMLSLDNTIATDDSLHTPQMVFLHLTEAPDSTLYSATNNQKNITISRSSSDESGTIREYETMTISRSTDEVTISKTIKSDGKIITNNDISTHMLQELDANKDLVNDTSVAYPNKGIKIHSNVKIRQGDMGILTNGIIKPVSAELISYINPVKDPCNLVTKDSMMTNMNKTKVENHKNMPIMSQRSIEFEVDSLATDLINMNSNIEKTKDVKLIKALKRNFDNTFHKKPNSTVGKKPDIHSSDNNAIKINNTKSNVKMLNRKKRKSDVESEKITSDDYEVIIKLPSGKHVKLKSVDEEKIIEPIVSTAKEILRKTLKEKADVKANDVQQSANTNNTINQYIMPTGTLIPVTVVNSANGPVLIPNTVVPAKVPIPPNNPQALILDKNKQNTKKVEENIVLNKPSLVIDSGVIRHSALHKHDDSLTTNNHLNDKSWIKDKLDKQIYCAASKRYRDRLKQKRAAQNIEIEELREKNKRLMHENTLLKALITRHVKKCPAPDDLRMQKKPSNETRGE